MAYSRSARWDERTWIEEFFHNPDTYYQVGEMVWQSMNTHGELVPRSTIYPLLDGVVDQTFESVRSEFEYLSLGPENQRSQKTIWTREMARKVMERIQ